MTTAPDVVDLTRVRRSRRAQAQARNGSGEFHSGRSLQEKLRIIRLVAETAARTNQCQSSTAVAERMWDTTRSLFEDEHGRIARASEMARQVRDELGDPRLTWRNILALAHHPDKKLDHVLKMAGREDTAALSAAGIAFALRLVARNLRKQTLSPLQYAQGRRELLRSRRRTPSGAAYLKRALPTPDAIITAVGNWPKALEIAGLQAATVLRSGGSGTPVATAIALYYAGTGQLPRDRKALDRFAKVSGFSLQAMRGKSWDEWLALGREEIATHPELPPPPKDTRA